MHGVSVCPVPSGQRAFADVVHGPYYLVRRRKEIDRDEFGNLDKDVRGMCE